MIANTSTRYGALARSLHWLIALLIIADVIIAWVGDGTPRNAENTEFLKALYSTHKTIGVTVLMLAVIRIAWAIIQPKPVPLHPERRAETFVAETIHWLLYGAIIIMPLSGWISHAAESGFAPIWWPFGQGLPFVPQSESVSHLARGVHETAAFVIYVTVGLHFVGAMKHLVIDRDQVVARMTRGVSAGNPATKARHGLAAALAAVVWLAIVASPFLGLEEGGAPEEAPVAEVSEPVEPVAGAAAPVTEAVTAGWTVETGALGFTVIQMGSPVAGELPTWTAAIDYDEASGTGTVTVDIDTTALTLGSVTDQAKGPEFFDTAQFATATFTGQITRVEGTRHTATGTLTLVGQTVPVTLDFDLTISGDTATMTGKSTLDRRAFGMGAEYEDESTVGFIVEVDVTLTARKS